MADYYRYDSGMNGQGSYTPVSGIDGQKAMNDQEANAILQQIMGNAKNQPDYASMVGPDGKLLSQYALTGQPDVGFQANDALGYLKDKATATGPSAWAQLQQQLINQQKAAGMDTASVQGNAATAQGMGSLATHGGLAKGARERMATKGAMSTLMAKQQLGRDANKNSLDMLSTDEQNKNSMLNSWASLNESDLGRKQNLDLTNRDYSTGVDKYNLTNVIGDKQAQQQFDMQKWQTGMQALGSYQTARAQEESGKK